MTKMKVDEHDECSEKTPNLMIHKTLVFFGGGRQCQGVAGSGRRPEGGRRWQAVAGGFGSGRQAGSAGGWQQ